MEIKKVTIDDLSKVLEVTGQAQDFFKRYDIKQWEDDYPNEEDIKNHIENSEIHGVYEQDELAGFAILSIHKGEEDDKAHAVLHLLAVDNAFKSKGIATEIMFYLNRLCRDEGVFRIKTSVHKDNIAMQRTVKKSGFFAKENVTLNNQSFIQYERNLNKQ